ncbi:pentapeptide repeat protein [Calothrix brevissima NIES-22]|nr:pentapeptide repeat protein [Calothrix brevissima NIES-22]
MQYKGSLKSSKTNNTEKSTSTNSLNNFSHMDLNGHDMSNRDLSRYNIIGAQLNGSNLSNTKLNGAKMQNAQLRGADLKDAKLCGVQLSDADLSGSDLRRADLNGADLRRANLANAKLDDANLNGANVQGAIFQASTGLTEDIKHALKNRGADFKNSSVVKLDSVDIKWWIQYVLVPLIIAFIGSGGIIVTMLNASKTEQQTKPTSTVEPTTKQNLSPKSMSGIQSQK